MAANHESKKTITKEARKSTPAPTFPRTNENVTLFMHALTYDPLLNFSFGLNHLLPRDLIELEDDEDEAHWEASDEEVNKKIEDGKGDGEGGEEKNVVDEEEELEEEEEEDDNIRVKMPNDPSQITTAQVGDIPEVEHNPNEHEDNNTDNGGGGSDGGSGGGTGGGSDGGGDGCSASCGVSDISIEGYGGFSGCVAIVDVAAVNDLSQLNQNFNNNWIRSEDPIQDQNQNQTQNRNQNQCSSRSESTSPNQNPSPSPNPNLSPNSSPNQSQSENQNPNQSQSQSQNESHSELNSSNVRVGDESTDGISDYCSYNGEEEEKYDDDYNANYNPDEGDDYDDFNHGEEGYNEEEIYWNDEDEYNYEYNNNPYDNADELVDEEEEEEDEDNDYDIWNDDAENQLDEYQEHEEENDESAGWDNSSETTPQNQSPHEIQNQNQVHHQNRNQSQAQTPTSVGHQENNCSYNINDFYNENDFEPVSINDQAAVELVQAIDSFEYHNGMTIEEVAKYMNDSLSATNKK